MSREFFSWDTPHSEELLRTHKRIVETMQDEIDKLIAWRERLKHMLNGEEKFLAELPGGQGGLDDSTRVEIQSRIKEIDQKVKEFTANLKTFEEEGLFKMIAFDKAVKNAQENPSFVGEDGETLH